MSHTSEHQLAHTKMVKQILKTVARQQERHYQEVFRLFVGEDLLCTEWFWTAFYRDFPDSPYHFVAFCHTCRRFDLYETQRDMQRDELFW